MNKDAIKSSVRRLWADAFGDTSAYLDMYFDHVYRDDEAVTLADGQGQVVSSLLLQKYHLDFQGQVVGAGYIAGATTDRKLRGHGNMTRLLGDALQASRERGDVVDFLMPSSRHLFFFYDRLGFSTVFYIDRRHYVAGAVFLPERSYKVSTIDFPLPEDFVDAFQRFEASRSGNVRHTPGQLENIVRDNALDGGEVLMTETEAGEISAIAFVVNRQTRLVVKELLCLEDNARRGMMREIVARYPQSPVTHLAQPSENRPMQSLGMARIVNAEVALRLLAENNPDYKGGIRVTDRIIQENSHIFWLNKGELTVDDSRNDKIDLDVPIDVLTSIVFSSPRIGGIFGLKTQRPFMSLMLD